MPGLKASTSSNIQVPTVLSKFSIHSNTITHILATEVFLLSLMGPGKWRGVGGGEVGGQGALDLESEDLSMNSGSIASACDQ